MATIGDLLPENLKSEIVSGNLKVGAIFSTFEHYTTPPKIKRFIIVGVTFDFVIFAAVYINTEINPNLFPSPELQALHLPVTAQTREYLDHDSFIDCSQIQEKNIEQLKVIYEKDINSYMGDVSADDLKEIRRIIKGTRTISLKKKKDYGLFF